MIESSASPVRAALTGKERNPAGVHGVKRELSSDNQSKVDELVKMLGAIDEIIAADMVEQVSGIAMRHTGRVEASHFT